MDSILSYLPEPLKVIREFKALATAEDPELANLWQAVEDAFNDQFIDDATEAGVARRESMYKIVPKATDTLDERKFRIKAKENERVPYTERTLAKQLAGLCGSDGYSLAVDVDNFTVTVRVALVSKSNFDEVSSLVDRVTPLNMELDVDLMYNQYSTLQNFTYAQLSAYTYDQLRNEVLT